MNLRKYVIRVQLDSCKDAEMVAVKEGYESAAINNYTEDLYKNNKVQLTIPTRRTFWGAVRQSIEYGRLGIFNHIVKV